jgi:hypothetical protein
MRFRCSTECPGHAAVTRRALAPALGPGGIRPATATFRFMRAPRLGTGVHRPGRRSRPWLRARRAARRSGNRDRCHCRRRVTARRSSSPLQAPTGRNPVQTIVPRASAASTGQDCPVNSARRGGMAALTPLHRMLGAKASTHTRSSRGVGGPGGISGPRAPRERDAAVLRHDGRQPGKAARRRTPTPSAQKQSRAQGGRKEIRWLQCCSLRGGGGVVAGSVERWTKAR